MLRLQQHSRRTRQSGFTLIELLVVIAIYSLLLAMVLPAVMRVRAAADRIICASRMRQIGIALHLYHNDYGAFPPGCASEAPGNAYPYMSWMTRLLSYLEQDQLWNQSLHAYTLATFFEDLPHQSILGKPLSLFACPTDDRLRDVAVFPGFAAAYISYLGVDGTNYRVNDGVLFLDSRIRLDDIHDGPSNTLMVGERPPSNDGNLGWWYAGWGQLKTGSLDSTLGIAELNDHPRYRGTCPPGPYQFQPGNPNYICSLFQFWSLHPLGANFLFADGNVRFLRYEIGSGVMGGLATRSGGEPVTLPD